MKVKSCIIICFILFMFSVNFYGQKFSMSDVKDINLRLGLRIYGDVDFMQITNLVLNSEMIINIKPLGSFLQLQRLELYNNKITDIKPLANLSNLTKLYLGRNKITNISYLSNLVNLQVLDLQKNRIFDITPLQNLSNIKELNLRGTPANVPSFADWKFDPYLQIYDVDGNWKEIPSEEKSNWGIRDGELVSVSNP